MSTVLRALVVSLALVMAADPAAAGQHGYISPPAITVTTPPGWSLTPSLGASQTYDDNVTLTAPGDHRVGDFVNVLNSSAQLDYNGPRGQVAAGYDGAFLLYRSSSGLNAYEQRAYLRAKRRLSARTAFFIDGSASAAPTTELLQLQLAPVPYVRTGSRVGDVRAGIESAISKRLTIVADVHGQGAHFDANAAFASLLLGGSSFGGGFALRERLSEKTTLTGDYDGQRASIGESDDIFVIQSATVGLERLLTKTTRVSGAIGVSRLGARSFGLAKTDPSYRFGLSRDLRSSVVDLLVSRSYLPSWSLGGATQNQELTVRLRVPLSRRVYTQSLVSWRKDEPVFEVAPPLKSLWVQGTVGYTAGSWFRIEAYYLGTRQTVVTPDQLLHHNLIGLQAIASKPVRLR